VSDLAQAQRAARRTTPLQTPHQLPEDHAPELTGLGRPGTGWVGREPGGDGALDPVGHPFDRAIGEAQDDGPTERNAQPELVQGRAEGTGQPHQPGPALTAPLESSRACAGLAWFAVGEIGRWVHRLLSQPAKMRPGPLRVDISTPAPMPCHVDERPRPAKRPVLPWGRGEMPSCGKGFPSTLATVSATTSHLEKRR